MVIQNWPTKIQLESCSERAWTSFQNTFRAKRHKSWILTTLIFVETTVQMTRTKEPPPSTNMRTSSKLANQIRNPHFWELIQKEALLLSFQTFWSEISQLFKTRRPKIKKEFQLWKLSSYIKTAQKMFQTALWVITRMEPGPSHCKTSPSRCTSTWSRRETKLNFRISTQQNLWRNLILTNCILLTANLKVKLPRCKKVESWNLTQATRRTQVLPTELGLLRERTLTASCAIPCPRTCL